METHRMTITHAEVYPTCPCMFAPPVRTGYPDETLDPVVSNANGQPRLDETTKEDRP